MESDIGDCSPAPEADQTEAEPDAVRLVQKTLCFPAAEVNVVDATCVGRFRGQRRGTFKEA